MFNAERWAEAYWSACEKNGEDPSEGLDFLVAVLPLAAKVSGRVTRTLAADHFVSMVKKVKKVTKAEKAGTTEKTEKAAPATDVTGVNAALALTWLLIRRGFADKNAELTEAIDRLIDERRGVLRVTLETADTAGADAPFLQDFEAALVKKHGAKAVRITAKANPELLCGYRWTIDGERRDYSLAGRLSQLEKVLKT